MTPEEKEEYMRNKRKEIAKKVQEKKLEQNKVSVICYYCYFSTNFTSLMSLCIKLRNFLFETLCTLYNLLKCIISLFQRYEDQDLKLAPLPVPKLVPTPDGLPNELFGEVAMVTQFISCYRQLLMPDDEYPIMTDALMKALVADKAGFTYLTRTLEVLLQTLLQDGIAEVNVFLLVRYISPFCASYTFLRVSECCPEVYIEN